MTGRRKSRAVFAIAVPVARLVLAHIVATMLKFPLPGHRKNQHSLAEQDAADLCPSPEAPKQKTLPDATWHSPRAKVSPRAMLGSRSLHEIASPRRLMPRKKYANMDMDMDEDDLSKHYAEITISTHVPKTTSGETADNAFAIEGDSSESSSVDSFADISSSSNSSIPGPPMETPSRDMLRMPPGLSSEFDSIILRNETADEDWDAEPVSPEGRSDRALNSRTKPRPTTRRKRTNIRKQSTATRSVSGSVGSPKKERSTVM